MFRAVQGSQDGKEMERSGICSGITSSENPELKSGKSHPNPHQRYESPSNIPGSFSKNTSDSGKPLRVSLSWETQHLVTPGLRAELRSCSMPRTGRPCGGGLASLSADVFSVREVQSAVLVILHPPFYPAMLRCRLSPPCAKG